MNNYECWLQAEKKWIGEYQRKIMAMIFLKVIPITLVITCALFGTISYSEGEGAVTGIAAGLMLGIFTAVIILPFVLLGLRPGRYVGKIRSAVRDLKMEDWEKERLGQEMLSAGEESSRCISYVLEGHGSRRTPARFRITSHYAFLEGSCPYAILVRLSDVGEIVPEEEKKTHTQRGAKTKVYENFILYTIYFYGKYSSGANEPPIQGMGFFEKDLRDRVMELIKSQLEENRNMAL